jgi:hypothetical protein
VRGAEQTPREVEDTADPVAPERVTAYRRVPVEAFGCGLKRGSHVAEPERAVRAVPQQVQTEKAQLVFVTGHANLCAVQVEEDRARIDAVPTVAANERRVVVLQINKRFALWPRPPDCPPRRLVLLGSDAEVYVADGAQSALGVEQRRPQTFQQDGLDARRAQPREDVLDLTFLKRGL